MKKVNRWHAVYRKLCQGQAAKTVLRVLEMTLHMHMHSDTHLNKQSISEVCATKTVILTEQAMSCTDKESRATLACLYRT